MNNFENVREGSNKGVDWMFTQFQAIQVISVALSINKMLQVCAGKVGGSKSSDVVGT